MIDQIGLILLYRRYFVHAGMTWPETRDAVDFAVTEIGEVVDALKRKEPHWGRHNPDKDRDLGMEISQAVMMLVIAADTAGVDLMKSTHRWMQEKGFSPD